VKIDGIQSNWQYALPEIYLQARINLFGWHNYSEKRLKKNGR